MKKLSLSQRVALTLLISAIQCGADTLPDDVKIQINVPDEPHPGTRTQLITFNLETDRNILIDLHESAERISMCSPNELLNELSAHEVMSVSFWGPAMKRRITYRILAGPDGKWLEIGHGNVEAYDHPQGFPKYRYSASELAKVHKWYEANIEK